MTSKNDPDAIRAKVLADPNTAEIAESLGVELDDYVDRVVEFVMNPKLKPELVAASDAALKAAGHTPPDQAEIVAYLKSAAALVVEKSKFTQAQKAPVSLEQVKVGEGVVAKDDPALKAALADQLRRNRSGKG